jgi:hypothetical protein
MRSIGPFETFKTALQEPCWAKRDSPEGPKTLLIFSKRKILDNALYPRGF